MPEKCALYAKKNPRKNLIQNLAVDPECIIWRIFLFTLHANLPGRRYI